MLARRGLRPHVHARCRARSIRTAPSTRRASRCRSISEHPVRRVPARAFRRRGDRGREAVQHRRAGRRDVRREGFPAAHGHPPHGRGPVHARGDRRRADGARGGRARDELAQPVPRLRQQRRLAPAIYRQLQQAVGRACSRASAISRRSRRRAAPRSTARASAPDYFTVRDAQIAARRRSRTRRSSSCSTAARLGKARLIDNIQFSGALEANRARPEDAVVSRGAGTVLPARADGESARCSPGAARPADLHELRRQARTSCFPGCLTTR